MSFDVLIIGAGPAGSAAARRAASRGLSVALVDRCSFPRDKVCGDALIPDALQALETLGLAASVRQVAQHLTSVQSYAPNGKCVTFAGESVCLPRRLLDDLLKTAAVTAGASFFAPLQAMGPLMAGDRVAGARFLDPTGSELEIRAHVTVLATGAAAEPLKRFGVCGRLGPSATAARVYLQVDPGAATPFTDLCISYDEAVCPGYGWIFPGPAGVFNVGVGYFYDAPTLPSPSNLRVLLDRFFHTFPPAVALLRHGRLISPLRGAPLRTAMTGATFSRPGLLVTGDAAGLTYSLSGEGIGKAMESGLLAADVIAAHTATLPESVDTIAAEYTEQLTLKFAERFQAYKTAQNWLTMPLLGNYLAWRANSGRFVKRQLEAMFAETASPRGLFSPLGMARALVS